MRARRGACCRLPVVGPARVSLFVDFSRERFTSGSARTNCVDALPDRFPKLFWFWSSHHRKKQTDDHGNADCKSPENQFKPLMNQKTHAEPSEYV